MQKLVPSDFSPLLQGSIFYGTGGGGSPKEAQATYQKIINSNQEIILKSLSEFDDEDIIITSFGVGSIHSTSDHQQPVENALKYLEKYLNKKIAGIIPVEIGPKSLAMAIDLASYLKLPVVDADIVGGRSTPEVFLETITMFNLSRTPSAIADDQGNVSILTNSTSAEYEEKFFRTFANNSDGRAYVVGYPLTIKQLKEAVCDSTITQCLNAGKLIESGKLNELLSKNSGKILFEGEVIEIQDAEQAGFTCKYLILKNNSDHAKVFIKNENLLFWINGQLTLTCPDLIIMTTENDQPIYNLDLQIGFKVKVIGLKAPALWRGEAGQALFNPKTFGFNEPIKLGNYNQ